MRIYQAIPNLKPFSGIPSPSKIKSLLLSRTGAMLHERPYLLPRSFAFSFSPKPQPRWTPYRSPIMTRCPYYFLSPQDPFSHPLLDCCTPPITEVYLKCHVLQEFLLKSHLSSHCLLSLSLVHLHGHSEFGKWMNKAFLTPCYRYRMVLYSRAGKRGFA